MTDKLHRFSDPMLDSQVEALCTTTREGWMDELGSFTSARSAGYTSLPSWSAFHGGHAAYKFSNNVDQALQIAFHIGHQWKFGTPIFPHVHFATMGGTSGVIRWNLELWPVRGYELESSYPPSIFMDIDYQINADNPHMIAECTDAQAFLTNIEPDTLVLCVVKRDTSVAGNYTSGDVFGLFADLHYQVNRLATPLRNTPFFHPSQ